MKIKLVRFLKGDNCSIGRLYLDGLFQCYTLEDTVRKVKMAGKTAIPTGVYQLRIDLSSRFGRLMPHLLEVPGFEGIRIHSGNTDKDTEGCILVGNAYTDNSISYSRIAFDALFKKLSQCKEPMEIQIVNAFE